MSQKTLLEFSNLLTYGSPQTIWYRIWKYLAAWQQSLDKDEAIAQTSTYFQKYGVTLNLGHALNIEERKERCKSLLFLAENLSRAEELMDYLPDILASFLFYEDYESYSYNQHISDELLSKSEILGLHHNLESLLEKCASSELIQAAKSAYHTRRAEKGYYWDFMAGTPHEDEDWMEEFMKFPELEIHAFGHAALLWTDDAVSFCLKNTTVSFIEICRALLSLENENLILKLTAYELDLEELPVGLGHFINLHSLYLCLSGLQFLSVDISKLTNLKCLTIDTMVQHQDSFADFSGLTSLEELSFIYCIFSELPPSIFKLNKLKTLEIEYNHSTNLNFQLSPNIQELKQLRKLKLSADRIYELPDEIGNLLYLEYLQLYCNYLNQLPDIIGNLTNLKKMHCYGCRKFTNLPSSLTKLINLQTLDISGLIIDYVPEVLFKLPFLESLSLGCKASKREIERLQKALPNTKVTFPKVNG